jgi:AcrR family transcriptional regulator
VSTDAQKPSPPRPRRADAQRNYERLVAAAGEVFDEQGAGASLEEVARRAGVGSATLHRNFPSRRHVLEAVYVDEVDAIAARAGAFDDLPPWDGFVAWIHEFVVFLRTKRALSAELLTLTTSDAEVFRSAREALVAAGNRFLQRGREVGEVRADVDFEDVGRMVGGILNIPGDDPRDVDRILALALDGLRYKP